MILEFKQKKRIKYNFNGQTYLVYISLNKINYFIILSLKVLNQFFCFKN